MRSINQGVRALVALALLCGLVGCGGISSRIKKHEREFLALPPEAQAQIQNGRIDVGFTEDMVYLAKGKPDATERLTREGRNITVWKYSRPGYGSVPGTNAAIGLSTPYGYPGVSPNTPGPAPLFYDRGYFRVEFENGRVARWDEGLQDDPDLRELKIPAP